MNVRFPGSTIDWDVTLQVSSPGPSTLVPAGWYVVPQSQRHSLLAGLEVNELDSWDVRKLGWLKAHKNGEMVTSSYQQLAASFLPTVTSCSSGVTEGKFRQTVEIDKGLEGRGRSVTVVHPFIKGVRVWQRHVQLQHRDSPLLSVSLQHRSKVGVLLHQLASTLDSFIGVLYQDSLSHTHLNLTLFGASGTITGVVVGARSSQSIKLRVSGSSLNSTHHLQLSTIECRAGQIIVTLRPHLLSHEKSKNSSITKKLPCLSESMRSFRSAPSHRVPLNVTPVQDCLSCSHSWLYWLSPQNWLDAQWPRTRMIITATVATIIIINQILNYLALSSFE